MEIKESGFTVIIGDDAVVDRIRVEPDDYDIRILMHGVAFTPEAWREFTDACVYVRDRLNKDSVAPTSKSRVWDEGDDEPGPDVTGVRDRDGDIWRRNGQEWALIKDDTSQIWSFWPGLVDTYGPLREVTES